jgi:homoserine kinase type II
VDLLRHWNVGDALEVNPANGGMLNEVVIVRTAQGRFALKTYRQGFDPRRARVEHAVMQFLHAHDVPLMLPLELTVGGTLLEWNGRLSALYPFARGVEIERGNLTVAQARGAGETLARVHADLATYSAELPTKTTGINLERTLELIARLQICIAAKSVQDETDRIAVSHLDSRKTWLEAHSADLKVNLPELPYQALHGDYHDGNLFFHGDAVSAVIDWEAVCRFPRVWECLRAMQLSLDLEPQRTRAWLEAYRAVNLISDLELEAGVAFYTLERAHALWPVQAYYLEGNLKAAAFIRDAEFVPFEVCRQQLELS